MSMNFIPPWLKEDDLSFPSPYETDENGIVGIGGDFLAERLLKAYSLGIFPWPHEGYPILWFCPDPRFVLDPKKIIINKSLRKFIKKSSWTVRADENFLQVIKQCQQKNRKDQSGTWITDEMIEGYLELHKRGYAHSIEVFDKDELVGGLYGIALGASFFGESMFFIKSNASKMAFVSLAAHLIKWDFTLIDCQAHTKYLESFGAKSIAKNNFLASLELGNGKGTLLGPWRLEMSAKQALCYIKEGSDK